jgi:hypothetical protein
MQEMCGAEKLNETAPEVDLVRQKSIYSHKTLNDRDTF